MFRKDVILGEGFDPTFVCGEDLDIWYRLRRKHARMTVSRETTVYHWFEGSFGFVKAQWLADGRGMALFSLKHAPWSLGNLLSPLLAAVFGTGMSVVHLRFQFVPYFLLYAAFNYLGVVKGILSLTRRRSATT